jgi:hypothetical protein
MSMKTLEYIKLKLMFEFQVCILQIKLIIVLPCNHKYYSEI